jgi:hypothetical protein
LADIDIESEKLRFLGGLRFETWAVWRLMKMKSYKGVIYYTDKENLDLPGIKDSLNTVDGWQKEEGEFIHFFAAKLPLINETMMASPLADPKDSFIDL